MAQTTHNPPAAIAYAKALLELATEQNVAPAVGEELSGLQQVIIENPSFRLFLADPAVGETEQMALIDKILAAGQVSQLVRNFIGVLNDKGRLSLLESIADAYDRLLDEQLGKVEVDVTVAHKLSPDQVELVRQKVSAALKKDAVIHLYVDESIIGGIVLRVGDQLIDASVRHQLDAMRQQLLAAARK